MKISILIISMLIAGLFLTDFLSGGAMYKKAQSIYKEVHPDTLYGEFILTTDGRGWSIKSSICPWKDGEVFDTCEQAIDFARRMHQVKVDIGLESEEMAKHPVNYDAILPGFTNVTIKLENGKYICK